ncbi:MAG: hypothetical protein ACK2U9_04345 [Anaerolineae bacterium]
MDTLVFGLLLVALGLLPGALLFLASRRSGQPPEITAEELALAAAGHVSRTARPMVPSRYGFRATTAPAAGNPGPLFDAYLFPDRATWLRFGQGQPGPEPRVQRAQQVAVWRASTEVGAGEEATLLLANPGPEPLAVSLVTERQAVPPALRGRRGSLLLWAALAGAAGVVAGALLVFFGLWQRIF